ncbi:hypothetical protein FA15DRAFT_573689, partial [Coprinopsis marcescibilis]
VVNTLRKAGLRCAFLGSMGCRLYGNKRLPQELDVLVFPTPDSVTDLDSENVKERMVNRNRLFYSMRAADPTTTHHYLFRQIPQHAALPPNYRRRFCKVEVLVPGEMGLPYLNEKQVNEVEGLPVVPMLVLLLQKLQGWEDHLQCVEVRKVKKHTVDVEDIKDLLQRVGEMPVRMFRPWSERELLGTQFINASKARVKRFCAKFPGTAVHWKGLGF